MKLIHIILIAIVAFSGVTLSAKPDYSVLETKARRFFKYREWPNASAMFELMLADKPKVISSYNHAIVSTGMEHKPDVQYALFKRAINNAIPFDSIFSGVRDISVQLVQPAVYTDFMKMLKAREEWLERPINSRLLRFYTFRKDADNMIEMAKILLETTPDNINYLNAMAEGHALNGDYMSSVKSYNKILLIDKKNYKALISLGNYYYLDVVKSLEEVGLKLKDFNGKDRKNVRLISVKNGKEIREKISTALGYLERAGEVKMTPFLHNMIVELRVAQDTIH